MSKHVKDAERKQRAARRLRSHGLFLKDIAEKLGVSRTWVQERTKDIAKPHCEAYNRLPKGHNGRNRLLNDYKRSAMDRSIEWLISDELFFSLTRQNCHYCGSAPTQMTSQKNEWSVYTYNGIDRADNSVGYSAGNVVACCKKCNKMKGVLSSKDFLSACEKITKHGYVC